MFEKRDVMFLHIIHACTMLSLSRIPISALVVANPFIYMHSGMILLYLATPFFTPKVFLYEDIITFCKVYICMYVSFGYYYPLEPSGITQHQ